MREAFPLLHFQPDKHGRIVAHQTKKSREGGMFIFSFFFMDVMLLLLLGGTHYVNTPEANKKCHDCHKFAFERNQTRHNQETTPIINEGPNKGLVYIHVFTHVP